MIRFTSIAKHSLILLASALVAACGGGGGGGGLGSSNQAPVFSSGSGSVTTPENNTGVIYTAQASDPDGSIVGFYLSGGEDQDDFSIDALSGNLRFNEGQDRENPTDANYDGIYVVEISVSDTGGAVSSMSLSVSLSDVDEAPIITAGQTLSVDENSAAGTAVGSATATNDGISVGLQNWRLVEDGSDGLFVVDANGAITVAEGAVLNHERADGVAGGNSYTLGLTVSDGKFTSSVGDVVINIADVNEPPVIEAGKVFEVYEDSVVGAEVGYAVATDVDSADADVNKWTITGSSTNTGNSAEGLFDISSSNGQITLAQAGQLDFDDKSNPQSYTLTLTVSDQEYTSAEETVQINVTDANDNKPTINNPEEASFSIDENSVIDEPVGDQLTASDVDTNTVYQDWKITSGNTDDVFGINSVESDSGEIVGQIVVAKGNVLDVDADGATTSYNLEVTVSDGANTSEPITVTVNINGVNDELPVITANQSFEIEENATSSSTNEVYKVQVNDADGDTTFQDWQMTPDDAGFSIGSDGNNGGYIYLDDNSFLDYETSSVLEFELTVSDGKNVSRQEILEINLVDVNDNEPVIESWLSFDINENNSVGAVIGSVAFEDKDSDEVNTFTWSITSITSGSSNIANDDTVFAIDNTGEITAKSSLNHEDKDSYTLSVQVSDGDYSDTEDVTVNVVNVNDPPSAGAVVTGAQGGDISNSSLLLEGTVLWLDASSSSDEDSDGLSYEWIQTQGPDGAELNSTTGVVVKFSGNNGPGDYEFNLTVTDDGVGGLTDTVSIGVSIAKSALPDDFKASIGPLSGSVELTWTPYKDSSGNETATYTVYRSDDVNCGVGCSGSVYVPLTDIDPDFVDTGLNNKTTYYYHIEASRSSGAVVETATEVVSATPMGAVNDTGVTWDENSTSYSKTLDYDYYLSCDGSSDIESPQDCHQGRDATDNNDTDGYAGFNFTRLYESNGSVYTGTGDYSTDPWGCVRDNVTGLVWEVKLPTSGVRFRDQSFTIYARTTNPTTKAFSELTDELKALNNNEGLCGYTTWRKPTIAEIQSIHTPSGSPYATGDDGVRNDGYQYLDLDYFPNTGTFSYSYWSDTAYLGSNSDLLAFSANQGDALDYKNYDNDAKIKLRLVVSDGNHTSNDWSDSRYDVTDDTITDLATGLVWMQCSLGQTYDSGTCSGSATPFDTWKAALDKAAEDEYASSGWRLPNIKELSSLLDGSSGASSPYVYSKFGSGTHTDYDYWSSTPSRYGNSNDGTGYPYSLTVDFGDGSFKNVRRDGSDNSAKYVRLVKSLRD